MNQLQHLLHDALIGTEHVSNAAIVRRKDHHLAACTEGFELDAESCAKIVEAFKNRNAAILRLEGWIELSGIGDLDFVVHGGINNSVADYNSSRVGVGCMYTFFFL